MSNTKWRLSGALGEPEEVTQVMTQGIGFPLRPVDGVPAQDSGDLIGDLPIAEGSFMQWQGPFIQGLIYPTGSVVQDEGWLMIANKATVEKAAPQSTGTPEWAMGTAPAWSNQNNLSVIYSGHIYEFNTSGWLQGLRIWVPSLSETTNYRIVLERMDTDPPRYQTIEEPVLTAGAWTTISTFDEIVSAGTQLLIYIDALDSGGDSLVTGGWTYNGSANTAPPSAQGWNHPPQQEFVRIDKTDLDSTDRTTELLGMVPGTTLQFSETADSNYSITYRTTGEAADMGTYVQMNVLVTNTGPAGAPRAGNLTTLTGTVPVAQTTDYVRLVGGAPSPSWATVTGYLAYDGVDQVAPNDGFGVDLYFDEAVISEDWDFMAVPGA